MCCTCVVSSITDDDGRCNKLLPITSRLLPGLYKITFKTGDYFVSLNRESFYPMIEVGFDEIYLFRSRCGN